MLSLSEAQSYLKPFVCVEGPLTLSPPEKAQVQAALACLVAASDYLTLGICSDNLASAQITLEQYLQGFGQAQAGGIETVSPAPEQGCYLKYNTRRIAGYAEVYTGPYRGVLIAFQSDLAAGFVGTYGHFPLDLFANF